jgi:photosystem II stability/assembly factor-like uncharacterized protein
MRIFPLRLSATLMTAAAVTTSFSYPVAQARTQPQWGLQKSHTSADLADISCSSVSACVAVGANATIVKTTNAGKTWTLVSNQYSVVHPSTVFSSVRCPATGVCSVLAPPDTVLRTLDGGKTWRASTIPLSPLLAGITWLACPTRMVCFATASPGGSTFTWFTHSAAIFETSDGSRSWQRLQIPSRVPCPGDCGEPTVGYDLQWISCQNAQSCRAGGDTFIGSHEGYASAVLRTANGGATWQLVHHSFDANIGTCPTVSICSGIFYQPQTPNVGPYLTRTTDAGTTWTSKSIHPVFTAIACSGKSFCQLVGPSGRVAMATGMKLTPEISPTTRNLNAVACPRAGVCYAVGQHGTIVARKG